MPGFIHVIYGYHPHKSAIEVVREFPNQDLDLETMRKIQKGERKSHKGWMWGSAIDYSGLVMNSPPLGPEEPPEVLKASIIAQQKFIMDTHLSLTDTEGDISDMSRQIRELTRELEEVERENNERLLKEKELKATTGIANKLIDAVSDYSQTHKGEPYTHMAVKNFSNSVARIVESRHNPAPLDLESRIQIAESKGFRWNSNNVRPTKSSTLSKKINQWETEYNSGLNYTPHGEVLDLGYNQALKLYGKGFLTGLCDRLQEASSNSPLPARFKSLEGAYRSSQVLKNCEEVSRVIYGTIYPAVVEELVSSYNKLGKLSVQIVRNTYDPARMPNTPWDQSHSTNPQRVKALQEGLYDWWFESVLGLAPT